MAAHPNVKTVIAIAARRFRAAIVARLNKAMPGQGKALPEQGILLLACRRRCLNKASSSSSPAQGVA